MWFWFKPTKRVDLSINYRMKYRVSLADVAGGLDARARPLDRIPDPAKCLGAYH